MARLLQELLSECARGDDAAISELVARFKPTCLELAKAILHDEHLAEDAVQSAFVIALQRLGQLRQADAFGAWLRQIVRSQAGRILRRADRGEIAGDLAAALEEPGDSVPTPQRQAESAELRALVRQALARTSAIHRQAAEMFYFEEMEQSAIARVLQVPDGTIKRRLHDVRKQLRNMLLGYIDDGRLSDELKKDEGGLPL